MAIVLASRDTACMVCKRPIQASERMVWQQLKAYHVDCVPPVLIVEKEPLPSKPKAPAPAPSNKVVSVNVATWPILIVIGMLLWALFPNPYGYYRLLRVVVCGVSIYLSLKAIEAKRRGLLAVLLTIAVLFNPALPVYVDRETWEVLDILTAGILGLAVQRLKPDAFKTT